MRRLLAPAALGVSLNGFWIYLGGLDVAGVAPRTPTTAVWYALVGSVCLAGAWLERDTLVRRLTNVPRWTRWWVIAASLLAVWFLMNVVLVSHVSSLSRTLAALLVLWSLPTAVLALSLTARAAERTAVAVAILGVAYAIVEWASLLRHHGKEVRFSPIAQLDPITAAQFPALGAIALLALSARSPRLRAFRLLLIAALVAGVVVPGSRGPIIAVFAAGLAMVFLLRGSERWLAAVAVAVGLGLGYAASTQVGSSEYLSQHGERPISTLTIRREWWTTAIEDVPDAPIVGHGVAMFVDNTPEAHRMGVAGTRTYPHNSPLESLYSLGVIGALPYAVYLVTGVFGLIVLIRRRRRAGTTLLAVGLWVFAFSSANISGEIGADAWLWAAGALAVGLYADAVAAKSAEREQPSPRVPQPGFQPGCSRSGTTAT